MEIDLQSGSGQFSSISLLLNDVTAMTTLSLETEDKKPVNLYFVSGRDRRYNSTWLAVSQDEGITWRRCIFDNPDTFGLDEKVISFVLYSFILIFQKFRLISFCFFYF